MEESGSDKKEIGAREFDNWNHRLNLWGRSLRLKLFTPVTKVLMALGFNATRLTNFRLILGLFFIPWFFHSQSASAIFMLVILILDTFDGDLARRQGEASDRGKFHDMLVDHIIYCITILLLPVLGASWWLVAVNMVVIPLAYLLAVLKRGEYSESDWLIKPYPRSTMVRLFPVIAFFLFVWFRVDYLDISLWVSNVWALVQAVYHFVIVQIRWKRFPVIKKSLNE